MGIISRYVRTLETRASLDDVSEWLKMRYVSDTGVPVSETSAIDYSPVYAAVRVIAESVGVLPFILYERRPDGGKERVRNEPLSIILRDQANPETTALEFWETIVAHTVLWGNGYGSIHWGADGRVQGVYNLRPDRIEIKRDSAGKLYYLYSPSNGSRPRSLSFYEVLHIRGVGFDGIRGYSPIRAARNAIGLGIAAERYGSTVFKQGSKPGLVLKSPGTLSDKAYSRLKENWERDHAGIDNAGRAAILEEGLSAESIGIPPEDAQYLETRRFQKTEIAMIYRIPPHMLADLDRATFNNVESMGIQFVTYSLLSWLRRVESAVKRDLIFPADPGRRRDRFAEFLIDGFQRGDISSRYAAYNIGKQAGFLSTNDIRRLENMNPIPGGDSYWTPLNVIAGRAGYDPGNGNGDRLVLSDRDGRIIEVKELGPGPEIPNGFEDQDVRAIGRSVEIRTAITDRHAFIGTVRAILAPNFERILSRIKADIMREAERHFQKRGTVADFESFLDDYFRDGSDVENYGFGMINPVLAAAYETIRNLVEREVAGTVVVSDDILESFISSISGSGVRKFTRYQMKKIIDALQDALSEGSDPINDLRAEFDSRMETDPDTFSHDLSARSNNAFSRFGYLYAGITIIRWKAVGDSCPYCRNLDGRTVGIQENFFGSGDSFEPEGSEGPLTFSTDVKHGPIHRGCDCLTVAGGI